MAAAAPAPSLRDRHWHVVNIVVGSGVVAAIQVGKAAIVTPMLQKDLGLDLAAAGWLTGIIAVLGLLGGIPAGLCGFSPPRGSLAKPWPAVGGSCEEKIRHNVRHRAYRVRAGGGGARRRLRHETHPS